jgi:hypothetical protein
MMARQWASVLRRIEAALAVAVVEVIGMVVVEEVAAEVADILSTTEIRFAAAVDHAMAGGIAIVTETGISETEIAITHAMSVTEISTDEQIDSTDETTIEESNVTNVTVQLMRGRRMEDLYRVQIFAFLAVREAHRFHRRLHPAPLEVNRQKISTNRAQINFGRFLPLPREIFAATLTDLILRPRVLKLSGSPFCPRDLHPRLHLKFPLLDL